MKSFPFVTLNFSSLLTVFLCIVVAQGLGLAIGATLTDLTRATTLASATVMTFMLAGGFFVQIVPIFISWIRYMSFQLPHLQTAAKGAI
ncbi:ABC transporter G member 22 [Stylosanthes scabra]|uniref:ABC transporter G member 22 n=1 Tax=Stylosanthes scabra TaxID=79078 RepID=A0ABU6R3J4_9FABA|nr:ABC transporter G member 22 [Stylosanthes scabra]